MAAKKATGPVFLRYVPPIVDTLRELGNSGTPSEVTDRVIERLRVSEHEQEQTTSNGQLRVRNQIAWARFYLVKAGYVDASRRGVWGLTDAGRNAELDDREAVLAMFKSVQAQFPRRSTDPGPMTEVEAGDGQVEAPDEDDGGYRGQLLVILRTLPPAGFERVCQRLLRESGFQRVEVTGKAGDGGIDGHGVLEINPLVTFRVLFQCKRYGDNKPVTPSQIRDFRGAMQGRADKGLILTTGTFTTDGRREATRDGVPPIELVDGEKLIAMFERVNLGLTPKQTFEVDHRFFDDFKK